MLTKRTIEKHFEREVEVGPDGVERPGVIKSPITEVEITPLTAELEAEDVAALLETCAGEVIAEQSQDAAKTIASAIKFAVGLQREVGELVAELGREEIAHERSAVIADAVLALIEQHPTLRSAFGSCLAAARPAAVKRLETLKEIQGARERRLQQLVTGLESIVSAFEKAVA